MTELTFEKGDVMSKLYIHIGLHRTGSTFLQQYVFYELSGVAYQPKQKKLKFIQHALYSNDEVFLFSDEQFSSSPVGPFLVHNEWYGYRSWAVHRQHVLSRLKALFPQARIILGVREQLPWLLSIYNLYLMYGGKLGLMDFWHDGKEPLVLEAKDLKIEPIITEVCRLWPDVHIFNFDDIRQNRQRFMNGLLNFINLNDTPVINNKQTKSRLSFRGQKYVGAINGFYAYFGVPLFFRRIFNKKLVFPLFSCFSSGPIHTKETHHHKKRRDNVDLKVISDYYREDWNNVLKYLDKQASKQA